MGLAAPVQALQPLPKAGGDTGRGGEPAADPLGAPEFATLPPPRMAGFLTAAGPAVPAFPLPVRPAELVAQIVSAIDRRDAGRRVELRLDPPELGRVTLHIATDDGNAVAVVTVDRPETLDLLRRHAELLQRELTDAGFRGAQLSFGSSGQRSEHPGGGGQPARFDAFAGPAPGLAATGPAGGAPAGPQRRDGPLDIRL
ncbi:flagellar hook-length control protein FliK [Oceanicella sp. SM1341]|uniref:flagellar hook-length control protein FliK n=1 Tax=Oceanicella sp. SM1341 TaxID=1548889 RepID=UPI001300487D|nr:flagellar hook-length control protein FliK [Oceanicella sp. SM1341]